MANLYILLDATHTDYKRLVASLHAKINDNFTPRLKLDGTQALIQVKNKYIASTTTDRSRLSSFVLGSGDENWAVKQVSGPEWSPKWDEL